MYRWLESTNCIQYEIKDRVATISLNRPERRNALSRELLIELADALLESDDRADVSVIVIKGMGKDFCSGYDVATTYVNTAQTGRTGQTERAQQTEKTEQIERAEQKTEQETKQAAQIAQEPLYRDQKTSFENDIWRLERAQALIKTIVQIHKPVIAQVHGNCLAGGTDLALYCDIVLAAEDARIGFPATRSLGVPPNMMWPYLVGPQWAKRILFTGDLITGADAAQIGLVLDAYPAQDLEQEVTVLARRIALNDQGVLAALKRSVNLSLELAGADIMARLATEIDARAHQSQGPRQTAFMNDLAAHGLKEALKRRDQDYGDSVITLNALGKKK